MLQSNTAAFGFNLNDAIGGNQPAVVSGYPEGVMGGNEVVNQPGGGSKKKGKKRISYRGRGRRTALIRGKPKGRPRRRGSSRKKMRGGASCGAGLALPQPGGSTRRRRRKTMRGGADAEVSGNGGAAPPATGGDAPPATGGDAMAGGVNIQEALNAIDNILEQKGGSKKKRKKRKKRKGKKRGGCK